MNSPRSKSRAARLLMAAVLLAASLAACQEPFGTFNNPYDRNSPNYQGYPAVENPADIEPVTVDAPNLAYMPTLVALTVHGAVQYRFQVDDDPAFGSPVLSLDSASNRCPPGQWPVLATGAAWYWRTCARETANWGPWSTKQASFSLSAPSIGLTSPTEAQAVTDTTPAIDWGDVQGAVKYRFQLAKDNLFATVAAHDEALSSSSYAVTAALDNDTNYYWRVAAANADGGWSPWATVRGFGVDWNPTVSVVSPGNAETMNDTTPILDWTDASDATGYDLRMADSAGALAGTTPVSVTASTYEVTTAIPNMATRWWSVTPYNVDGVRGATRGPWSFTIDIGRPAPLSPLDGMATTDTRPTFSWSTVANASPYHFQLATNVLFGGGTIVSEDSTLTVLQHQPGSALTSDATYYWRVRAFVGGAWGEWSSTRSLFIGIPVPVLEIPADGANVADSTPAFEWADAKGSTGYHVQLATDSGFSTGLIEDSTLTASWWNCNTPLVDRTQYWWRVKAKGDDGATWGAWSAARSFTLALPLPTLVEPADAAIIDDTTPAFDWTDISGATRYEFQLANMATFETTLWDTEETLSAHQQDVALSMAESYFWRVRVRNADGVWSVWTDPFSFRYSLPVPGAPDLAADDDTGISNTDNITNKTTGLTFSGTLPSPGLTVRLYSDIDGIVGTTTSGASGTWIIDATLSPGSGTRTHSVTVATASGTEESARSPALSVTVDTTVPAGVGPALKTPRIGEYTGTDRSPRISWTPCADPMDGYLVEADDDPAFGSPELSATVVGGGMTAYQMPSDLPVSTTAPVGRRYWFRVRGIDTAGNATGTFGPARYANVGRFMNDVNGDGYSDLIAGASGHDEPGLENVGRVYIHFGGPTMDSVPDVVITGTSANQGIGRHCAGAGDFNGDGFADLVTGNGLVFFGGSPMDTSCDVQLVDPSNYLEVLSGVGDLDADGYDEIAANINYIYRKVHVFRGGPTPDGTIDVTVQPSPGADFFGYSIAAAGDLNLDGYADMAIGDSDYDDDIAPNNDQGAVYIYYGGAAFDGTYVAMMHGNGSRENYGHGVSSAGDFDGDGDSDLIVGSPNYSGSNTGIAFLYDGSLPQSSFDTTADATINTGVAGEAFGSEVAGGGDLNGDGFDDLVIGSAMYAAYAGRVAIVWGTAGALGTPNRSLTGAMANDLYGHLIFFVGDCNADGYDDFAVGAYMEDSNGVDSGSVYLYFGQSSMTAPTTVIEFKGENANDQLGYGELTIGA